MSGKAEIETELHTLYLSDRLWGELLRRAVMEETNASALVDYVLRWFLMEKPELNLPRARRRPADNIERYRRRNLHLRKTTWQEIETWANAREFSISVLIETLMRNYLALELSPDLQPRTRPEQRDIA